MPDETETKQDRGTGRWGSIGDIPSDKGPWPATSDAGGRRGRGDRTEEPPSYYDISMLKPPVWTPEVGAYFFFGGLSSYAYVLARLAERFGGPKYRGVTRIGTLVAGVAALPCAPLLIMDLGDPKRFHHMLRVWKPSSPMNLGTWALMNYTAFGATMGLREIASARRGGREPVGAAKVVDRVTALLGDVFGIPIAILLAGYTGVLISTTATPVWCKNPWIGPLFSASGVSAGAGTIRLALEMAGGEANVAAADTLAKVETAARIVEAVTHAGYLTAAGELAKPLTAGEQKTSYWGGAIAAGILLPEIINRLPLPKKLKPWAKIAGGLVGLAGGYLLRSAFVSAGRPSANDPEAARRISRGPQGDEQNSRSAQERPLDAL